MRKTLLIGLFVAGFLVSGAAGADLVTMPPPAPVAAASIALPAKGESMANVVKQLGQPQVKHSPAGGDSRKHPPITRWEYDGYSVFFERDHVVDAVIKDHPAQVHHVEELKTETH